MNGQFKGRNSPQTVSQCRLVSSGHSRIRNDHAVAFQFRTIGFQERTQGFAADFLLTFDDKGNVAGQFRSGLELSLDGFEMSQILAFVVASASRKQRASDNARLERR